MRQITLLLLLFTCLVTSANNLHTTTDTSRQQHNLRAARIVMSAFITGDTSMIDSIVAADFIDHTGSGDMGRDSLKAMIMMSPKQFPGIKHEILREFADDEYVFLLAGSKGISNGEMGMPKGPYDMKSVEVIRFKDGKIAEHWTYMESGEILKMLSTMDLPGK